MAFSKRSSSLGLTKAFTNLLSSKHFNNYSNVRTEPSKEYFNRNIPPKETLVLPPNKIKSVLRFGREWWFIFIITNKRLSIELWCMHSIFFIADFVKLLY